jgi:hypothetical protein
MGGDNGGDDDVNADDDVADDDDECITFVSLLPS